MMCPAFVMDNSQLAIREGGGGGGGMQLNMMHLIYAQMRF